MILPTSTSRISNERTKQAQLVNTLREVYGQHQCDSSKKITEAQLNDDKSPINDCLGHPNGKPDRQHRGRRYRGRVAGGIRGGRMASPFPKPSLWCLFSTPRAASSATGFFTSSFRPEFYGTLGVEWVMHNGPGPEMMEQGTPNGHEQPVSS